MYIRVSMIPNLRCCLHIRNPDICLGIDVPCPEVCRDLATPGQQQHISTSSDDTSSSSGTTSSSADDLEDVAPAAGQLPLQQRAAAQSVQHNAQHGDQQNGAASAQLPQVTESVAASRPQNTPPDKGTDKPQQAQRAQQAQHAHQSSRHQPQAQRHQQQQTGSLPWQQQQQQQSAWGGHQSFNAQGWQYSDSQRNTKRQNRKASMEAAKQLPADPPAEVLTIDESELVALQGPLTKGDVIAYQLLEIGEDFTPQVL